MKDLFSHLIVEFFKVNSVSKRSFRKGTEPVLYHSIGTNQQNGPNSTVRSNASAPQYTPITNVFNAVGKHDEGNEESAKGRELVSTVDGEKMKGILVPVLEDEDKKVKEMAQEIIRDFYGITAEVDIWLALQRFDSFLQSRKTEGNRPSHSANSQKTFKREVSKWRCAKRVRRRIIECIQECQASTSDLWNDMLMMYAVSILRWDYSDLSELLQGKKVFDEKKIQPIVVRIHKLFRYERQIGEGESAREV